MNVWDEAEYERLCALDWKVIRYPDPVTDDSPVVNAMTFNMQVGLDGSDVILKYYSAQPPPDLGKLPIGVEIVSEHMYLAPHYCVFVRLRSSDPEFPLIPLRLT